MSIPRLPTQTDFPDNKYVAFDIVPPSDGRPPLNILILLHGLGDTKDSFTTLARNLHLPETACLSIQGMSIIPSLFTGSDQPSFHWAEDILFDSTKGEIDPDAGFGKTTSFLQDNIIEFLTSKCNFPMRNILFFGFGQGGTAALSLAASNMHEGYGGVISVGGPLSSTISSSSSNAKSETPILVCGGNRRTMITSEAIHRLKDFFADVEYVRWDREGDKMMKNREEMLPLMRFWARRLKSRVGVPDEAVEV